MIGILRCEERQPPTIELDLIEMAEIRIPTALLAISDEIESSVLLVDAPQLRDVPFTTGDLRLQLSGVEVIQIELSPVVTLVQIIRSTRAGLASWPFRCPTRTGWLIFAQNIGTAPVAASATRKPCL